MPRKYTKRITPEERAAIARANSAKRLEYNPPEREPRRVIRIAETVFHPLNAKRGKRTWSTFLAALAGLPPYRDHRRRP